MAAPSPAQTAGDSPLLAARGRVSRQGEDTLRFICRQISRRGISHIPRRRARKEHRDVAPVISDNAL